MEPSQRFAAELNSVAERSQYHAVATDLLMHLVPCDAAAWRLGLACNTVQLVGEYSEGGGVLGLGPVGVVGAFDLPFRHLAFDHSR